MRQQSLKSRRLKPTSKQRDIKTTSFKICDTKVLHLSVDFQDYDKITYSCEDRFGLFGIEDEAVIVNQATSIGVKRAQRLFAHVRRQMDHHEVPLNAYMERSDSHIDKIMLDAGDDREEANHAAEL